MLLPVLGAVLSTYIEMDSALGTLIKNLSARRTLNESQAGFVTQTISQLCLFRDLNTLKNHCLSVTSFELMPNFALVPRRTS